MARKQIEEKNQTFAFIFIVDVDYKAMRQIFQNII